MKAPVYGFGESELYHATEQRKHGHFSGKELLELARTSGPLLTKVDGHKKLTSVTG
jgi:hypothetical protein